MVAGQVAVSNAMAVTRAGDAELEAAVQDHARLVYRIAYSLLRNHHDAEDATQETFLRVLRYGRKLEKVRNRRNWLARIAWRVAMGRRRRMAEVPLEDAPEETAGLRSRLTSADELLFGREMSEVLERLIATLPTQLRDPLTLSTVEEMSPADIAEVLDTNEAAVRSRIFRARQILKEKLTVLLEGKNGT